MTNSISFWATVASPIVGVIAIVVALVASRRSSQNAQKQIDAIYNLLDVFVAVQNPTMMEAKKKYEQQLLDLERQMQALSEDIQTDNFPLPGGPLIYEAEILDDKINKFKQLEVLESKRKETEDQLNLIRSYIERTKKK